MVVRSRGRRGGERAGREIDHSGWRSISLRKKNTRKGEEAPLSVVKEVNQSDYLSWGAVSNRQRISDADP